MGVKYGIFSIQNKRFNAKYFILFYFILFYFILFYFILFYLYNMLNNRKEKC